MKKRGSNTIYIPYHLTNTTKIETSKSFKFGDGKLKKSFKKVKIPVIIAGVQATVTTDVKEYDIPLPLSEKAIKKAKTQLDFRKIRFGKKAKYILLQLTVIVLH